MPTSIKTSSTVFYTLKALSLDPTRLLWWYEISAHLVSIFPGGNERKIIRKINKTENIYIIFLPGWVLGYYSGCGEVWEVCTVKTTLLALCKGDLALVSAAVSPRVWRPLGAWVSLQGMAWRFFVALEVLVKGKVDVYWRNWLQ